MKKTSWQPVAKWYGDLVGNQGHYYHEHVILPNLGRLLALQSHDSLLDLGCGNGIVGRTLAAGNEYFGIDLSRQLVEQAQRLDRNKTHSYAIGDITKPLPITKTDFQKAVIVLALQNVAKPFAVIRNAAAHIKAGGKLIIVLNHPAFRIPQKSDWGVEPTTNVQYRREDVYMTPQTIAIASHPGLIKSALTYSFHYPLSGYTEFLHDNGFYIETIEEWVSDKRSTGGEAKREDMARREFPLFLTIGSQKKSV